MSAVPLTYYGMLAQIESGHRPYAKAATSSASGLYQLLRGTWCALGGEWGGDPTKAFGGLLPTTEQQTAVVAKLTEQNASALLKAAIPVTCATLYSAHFLGIGTAVKVLRAQGLMRVSDIVGDGVIKANAFLEGQTVGDFKDWLARKTNRSVKV